MNKLIFALIGLMLLAGCGKAPEPNWLIGGDGWTKSIQTEKGLWMVTAGFTSGKELVYAVFQKEDSNEPGKIESIVIGSGTLRDGKQMFQARIETPDGIKADLIGNFGLYEYIDGQFRKSTEEVSMSQFEDFMASAPQEYTIEALLNFIDTQKFLQAKPLEVETIDGLSKKGRALYERGKYDEAIKIYDRLTELDLKSWTGWFAKGYILFQMGKYEEAIKVYDKIIELYPKDKASWLSKGIALGKLGRYDEAVKTLDKLYTLSPGANVLFHKAQVYSFKKDKKNVLNELAMAISLDSKYKEKANMNDVFQWLWGDEDFRALTGQTLDPDSPEFKSQVSEYNETQGHNAFNFKNYQEAIDFFEKAVNFNPNNEEAWQYKASSLEKTEKYAEENETYDKMLEIFYPITSDKNVAIPVWIQVLWYRKGIALGRLGRYDEAIQAYNKAMELGYPALSGIYYNLATVYSRKQDKSNAIAILSKAIYLSGKIKEQALKDDAFQWLWEDEEFKKLTE